MRARQEEECQELGKVILSLKKYRCEREAREAFGYDGSKEKCDERSSGGAAKTDIPRNQRRGREKL